ncbi:MAG: ROK family protein, partial [Proteobacteria bacterium]|nr:ROK family protein [Pseudomonadota bacterium]
MTIDATLGTSGTTGAHDASHGDASPEEFHVQAVAAHAPGNALAGTGYVAGIDLGGTKILAAIFSPDGSIVSRAAKVARLDLSQVAAVGTGVPAPVDPVTGVVHMTPNIDGWEDMPLKQELGGRLDGIPVAIDNDVRVAVIAEHGAGAGVGIRNMVGIWPGTGVGGGLILDGRIYTGSSSYAGEIGHITIKEGGAPCGCGGRGHLEAYCSRTAIVRHLEKLIRDGKKTRLTRIVGRDLLRAKSSDLAEAAALGDAVVVSVLDRTARYLAIGIASIANLLNPEMIVLGGGVVEALGDDFVENVAKRVRREPFRATTGPLKIVASAL